MNFLIQSLIDDPERWIIEEFLSDTIFFFEHNHKECVKHVHTWKFIDPTLILHVFIDVSGIFIRPFLLLFNFFSEIIR